MTRLAQSGQVKSRKNKRIAVIGAGPAGVTAAYRLHKEGHEVTVYEQAAHIGGRSHSYRKEGFILDTGASFITNFYPRLFALAKEIGFKDQIDSISRVSGLSKQGQVSALDIGSLRSFLALPWIPLKDKAKFIAWTSMMTIKRMQFDIADPKSLVGVDHLSISQYCQTHLSESIYQHIIRPSIEPFWYFSCEEASEGLIKGLGAKAAGAKFYAFSEGIDQFCHQLIKGVNVELNTPIDHLGSLSPDYDLIVIATPATTALKLLESTQLTQEQSEEQSEEQPEVQSVQHSVQQRWFDDRQMQFLKRKAYAPNIHLAYRVKSMPKKPRVGAIFPCGPGEPTLAAVSLNRIKKQGSALPGATSGDEIISVYLSQSSSHAHMNSSDDELYAFGWREARALFPELPERYAPFHLVKRPEAIPIPQPGHYIEAAYFNEQQRKQASPIVLCGDYLTTATMEGAIASGVEAAACIAARY